MVLALGSKSLYDFSTALRRLGRFIVPEDYGDDRLIFRLQSDDKIELDNLGECFAGLARHFRRYLEDSGIDPSEAPSKLFVTDLKSGSVEFELATLALLYMYTTAAADGVVIWSEFYERLHRIFDYLAGRAPRPSNYTRHDARDLDAFLRTIAGKKGARLNVRKARFSQTDGRRKTIAEFDFDEQDVANAHMKLGTDLSDFDANAEPETSKNTHKLENNVPFIWFRTDREKGKSSGQTSDRGIVAKVNDRPLPVFFASTMESQKDQMTKTRTNPFNIVYILDVLVEYDEEENPKSYTILNIHGSAEDKG